MDRRGTDHEQVSVVSTDRVFERLGFSRTPGVYGLLNSYHQLTEHETDLHELHYEAMENVLMGRATRYAREMESILSRREISEYQVEKAQQRLDRVVESARSIDFPEEILARLSLGFIDDSLDYEKPSTPYQREAAASIGLAIGRNDSLELTKIRRIAEHHIDAVAHANQAERAQLAHGMLRELRVNVEVQQIPSLVDTVANLTRDHARSVATTGTAAVIAASILAPTAANATPRVEPTASSSESVSFSIPVSPGISPESGGAHIDVALPAPVSPDQPETLPVSGAPKKVPDTPGHVKVAMPDKVPSHFKPSIPIVETPPVVDPTPVEATPHVAPDEDGPRTIAIKNDNTEQQPSPAPVVPEVALPEPTPASPSDGELPPSPDVTDPTHIPVSISPEARPETPPADAEKKVSEDSTPEHKDVQTIVDTINTDGDISTAASLIRLAFHDKQETATQFSNGKPIYVTTNQALVDEVIKLEVKVEATVHASGHANVEYSNAAFMALAVLEAAANDQTVLQSPAVQQLLAGVTRPTDEYQGKLFDQYLAKAKETLSAHDSALLKGVSEQYLPQVETMYAYALMAVVSDSEQTTQIQAIKDAEAAAAAKAKAKAEAEARAKAEAEAEAHTGAQGDVELEVMKNLIDREQDPARKRTFQAMHFLMVHGDLTATQAAGIIGNMLVESAGTMDPSIEQFGGGPGRGMVQWEGGRWDNLQAYAAEHGKSWDDFDIQMSFLLSELPGRQDTLATIKDTKTLHDATFEFMVRFETPRVVVDAYETGNWDDANAQAQTRAERAEPILDAYNDELKAVKDQRADAAAAKAKAAKAKAEAEAAAKAKAEAAEKAESEKQSKPQKIVAVAQSELEKWVSGKLRPLANQADGVESYLIYTHGAHTDWCAYFVSDVLAKAGFPVPTPEGIVSHARVGSVKKALLSTGQYTWHDAGDYTPQAGDVAFYGDYDHINFVISGTSPEDFNTIGGNEGNSAVPDYAARYGGEKADNTEHPYDNSYVVEEPGANFQDPVGFLSINN